MSAASSRGWGRGWPQNNSSKMVTIRAEKSGVVLSVHREVAPILKFCIDTIEARDYLFDYGPKDVNDDWGYANRPIRGTSIPSNHSWGLAVDLDAQQYPQGQRKRRPPQWIDDVFAKYRFDNGAPWANPDPMHYEFNGTPADARFLVASLAAHHIDRTPPPMPPSAPPVPSPVAPPPYVGPPPPPSTPTQGPEEDDMRVRVLRYTNQPVEYWLPVGACTVKETRPSTTQVISIGVGGALPSGGGGGNYVSVDVVLPNCAINLNQTTGEVERLKRTEGFVEIIGDDDCNGWKTFTNEVSFAEAFGRPGR